MAFATYDPAQVSVIFNGIPVTGYGEGTFVTAERNEDSFTLQVGASGDATRAKTNNRSGRVTLTLIQSSATNDAFSAMITLDELSPTGEGVGPLLVKDLSGRTLVAAETAWLVKPATSEFARDASEREWIIETNDLSIFTAGN